MYAAHETICRMAKQAFGRQTALARIGHYGTPPSKRVWAAQCAAYLAAIVFNKVVVASLLYAAKGAMTDVGNWLFGPLQSNPDADLVVVMVLCPWLLTSLQFWIFDFLLKAKDPKADGSDDGVDSGGGADGLPYTALAAEKNDVDGVVIMGEDRRVGGVSREELASAEAAGGEVDGATEAQRHNPLHDGDDEG